MFEVFFYGICGIFTLGMTLWFSATTPLLLSERTGPMPKAWRYLSYAQVGLFITIVICLFIKKFGGL